MLSFTKSTRSRVLSTSLASLSMKMILSDKALLCINWEYWLHGAYSGGGSGAAAGEAEAAAAQVKG
jgi:hypothetical protein